MYDTPIPDQIQGTRTGLKFDKEICAVKPFFNPLKIINATKCICKHPGVYTYKAILFLICTPPLHPLTPTCKLIFFYKKKKKIRTQKIENCFSGEQFDFEPACVDISDRFFFNVGCLKSILRPVEMKQNIIFQGNIYVKNKILYRIKNSDWLSACSRLITQ